MPNTTTLPNPTQTPVVTPAPTPQAWPDRFTDPLVVCPQQKRELTSPDVAP